MKPLSAGVVVITGGSSGIGRATAELFGRRGWRVGLIARGAEALSATHEALEASGVRAATAQADVADSTALAAAAATLAEVLGPIDLWINGAGNGVYGRFSDVPEREFQRVTEVTYYGVVNGTRVALAHMRPRGRGVIVNICSAIAFHGMPMMSSYAGAKAAVRAFAQALRGELALEGLPVQVCTVFPPAVNTPFFSHAVSHMGWPARPARPVYDPGVVAQGVWLAAHGRRAEMTISGTAAAFSLAARMAPGLIACCMTRLGVESQCSRDPEAVVRLDPTLFEPSRRPPGVHGPFGRGARTWSSKLWFDRLLTAVLQVALPRAAARQAPSPPMLMPPQASRRSAAASAPRPAPPPPHPALADLDEPAGVS